MAWKINILIVEDELLIAEMLKEMLVKIGHNVVGVVMSNADFSEVLAFNYDIDFAILDINLKGKKEGLDIAKRLKMELKIPFMFLTSYSDEVTVNEVARLQPFAYMVKPFRYSDVLTTMAVVESKMSHDNLGEITIKDGHLTRKLSIKNIQYIKSDGNYIELVTDEKNYLVRNTLDKFLIENNLEKFIRVHRSYTVNLQRVQAVNSKYVIIEKEKIPMSRTYKTNVLNAFKC